MLHAKGIKSQTRISPIDFDQIQPNAVELTVAKIWETRKGTLFLSGDMKQPIKPTQVYPIRRQTDGIEVFRLKGGVYQVEFEQRVQMGPTEAGFVVSRSTLMRNGIWMTSALYDSGFKGKMFAGLMIPPEVEFVFPKYERIAQFVLFEAEAIRQYSGTYQEM